MHCVGDCDHGSSLARRDGRVAACDQPFAAGQCRPASHRRSDRAFCRTSRRPVSTTMVSICPLAVGSAVIAAAPGTVIRVQRKGPGGLEMLVQHDGFVGIYSHFGMISPAFAEGKRTVAAGERLGVVGRTGVSLGCASVFRNDRWTADRSIPLPISACHVVAAARPTTTARRDTDGVTLWWSEGTISSRFPTDSTLTGNNIRSRLLLRSRRLRMPA